LPFFKVVGCGLEISRACLHFMQKPVTAILLPLH
jgi:hypothetical protein